MDKQHLIEGMYQYGRSQALALREEAPQLTDTQVIDRESFIPEWKPGVQVLNAVVQRSSINQVYRVLQAHDSTATPEWTPETQPALFSVCHTTDAAKAKPWAEPQGTSGMYYKDECYIDERGQVWRQVFEGGNVYDAAAMPDYWQAISATGEV